VLIRQNWEGAPLADLIRQQVDPFAGAGELRLLLDGPNVSVSPSAAQALGLALHELATNSVKYGALSRPQGQVAVTWLYERNGNEKLLLRLHWRERGGPRVSPPTHKGFGHAVIERMVAHSLNGDVILDFAPEGLSWSLSMPTTHLANKGPVETAHYS
jgi:two-component sensor histidine kinase